MRLALLPVIAAATLGAADAPPMNEPAMGAPPVAGALSLPPPSPLPTTCGDRIDRAREELGQPKLQRETASPDRALLIAAVDKRVDGCAVMQMHRDVNDLRPLPQPSPGPIRLIPAR